MSEKKNREVKTTLHPRNRNREKYDFGKLMIAKPELKNYLKPNKHGVESVDFANPKAVKLLNQALLKIYYKIELWDFPEGNLCPPIPGRADYIHYMADLLAECNSGTIPTGKKVTCLDIGVGANCIYPIIGVTEYNWKFIGADISPESIKSARNIAKFNPTLKHKIECRQQENNKSIFHGILSKKEKIDLSICNPPFHASAEEAERGTKRKVKSLSGKKIEKAELNFAGVSNELICEGGEYQFILMMVKESKDFSKNCFWFTTLVSKESNLKGIYSALEKAKPFAVKTIAMKTGNKFSRVVAWTFLNEKEQKVWSENRWKS